MISIHPVKLNFAIYSIVLSCLFCLATFGETREVEFETSEVTRPDVCVSPSGDWMIVSILGNLYRLSTEGGEARQLTFGPYFDSDPSISPDGKKVVFASDRDTTSNGNLFILNLDTGITRQITNDSWATQPVWSPDGEQIAFLHFEPEGLWAQYEFVAPIGVRSQIRTVSPEGENHEPVPVDSNYVRSVFFLNNGQLAWTALGARGADTEGKCLIQTLANDGTIQTITNIDGTADRATSSKDGQSIIVRQYSKTDAGVFIPQHEALLQISINDGSAREISALSNPQPRPRFGLTTDSVFIGELGRFWKVDIESGNRVEIPFSARPKIEMCPRALAPAYDAAVETHRGVQAILDPRLSSDSKFVIFTAAGYIWRQNISGGPAIRLLDESGFEWGAGVLSPDNKKLAYQVSEENSQRLVIADLDKGSTTTVLEIDRTGRFEPAWSPDGKSLVFVRFAKTVPSIHVYDTISGKSEQVATSFPRWMPRPHFSGDGKSIFYTDRNQVRRVSIEGGEPQTITSFKSGHLADAFVSSDGRKLAFRRNEEIWLATISDGLVTDEEARRITTDGGLNFSLSPDSQSLVYAAGNQLRIRSLENGSTEEIELDLSLPTTYVQPLYITNLRLLDFNRSNFTGPTTIFVSEGRIQSIGEKLNNRQLKQVKVIDAEGRYAIPGLFDMHTHVATPIHFISARDVAHHSGLLAFGVTSVRDMGSDITLVKAWTDRRIAYGAPVPRIFSGGAMVETDGPFFHGGSFFAKTAEDARKIVRKEDHDGVVAIKSYFTLPWTLQRAIADEARKQELPVVSHGLLYRESVVGAKLGRSTIEHNIMPTRLYDDALQLFRATGTHWTPTLGVTGGNGLLFAQNPHLLSCACLRAHTSVSDYAMAKEVEVFADLDPALIQKAYMSAIQSMAHAHQLGVNIFAGTDALNPNTFYGHSLHMELRHQANAKIPNIDILRNATMEAAKIVGAGEELGSLEAGKLADIVILDDNPLEDIRNAQTNWLVIQDGKAFASQPSIKPIKMKFFD